jgi:hypothetical protein
MDPSFIPLFADAGKAPGSASVKVLAAQGASEQFQPLDLPRPAAASRPPCGAAGQPVVTLQHEGQRVTQIRIQCSCGQFLELACEY